MAYNVLGTAQELAEAAGLDPLTTYNGLGTPLPPGLFKRFDEAKAIAISASPRYLNIA
ncbi:MAG TPA: hypothetical protein GX507_05300 [Clostridia bacterium]|nr:hypothetical protein [Clostridia bacterium]